MLDKTKLDVESAWKIVKKTRKSFLSEHTDPECQAENIILSDDYIKENINTIEENLKLQLNITSTPYVNISVETLQSAVQMYTYLNYCPPKHSDFLKSSIKLESPKNILFALISIIKTTKNADKRSAAIILAKAMELFKLENYKNIDAITREDAFENCRNITKSCNENLQMKVLG